MLVVNTCMICLLCLGEGRLTPGVRRLGVSLCCLDQRWSTPAASNPSTHWQFCSKPPLPPQLLNLPCVFLRVAVHPAVMGTSIMNVVQYSTSFPVAGSRVLSSKTGVWSSNFVSYSQGNFANRTRQTVPLSTWNKIEKHWTDSHEIWDWRLRWNLIIFGGGGSYGWEYEDVGSMV
jgi:hypothetical protein